MIKPQIKLEDAVSTKCVKRTVSGIKGLGIKRAAVINNENNIPTYKPVCHTLPLMNHIIIIAKPIHRRPRNNWKK